MTGLRQVGDSDIHAAPPGQDRSLISGTVDAAGALLMVTDPRRVGGPAVTRRDGPGGRRLAADPGRRPVRTRGRGLPGPRSGRRSRTRWPNAASAPSRRGAARHRDARPQRLSGPRAAQGGPGTDQHPGGVPDQPHRHGRHRRRLARRRPRLPEEAVRTRRAAGPSGVGGPRQAAAGPAVGTQRRARPDQPDRRAHRPLQPVAPAGGARPATPDGSALPGAVGRAPASTSTTSSTSTTATAIRPAISCCASSPVGSPASCARAMSPAAGAARSSWC